MGAPVPLLNQPIMLQQCIKSWRDMAIASVYVQIKAQNGGIMGSHWIWPWSVTGPGQAGLSCWDFHANVKSLHRVVRETKTSEWMTVLWEEMPYKRGQRRGIRADGKHTVTRITTLYNCGAQKKHCRMHNLLYCEVDRLQQQKISTSVCQEQEPEARVDTGSPKLDRWRTLKFF